MKIIIVLSLICFSFQILDRSYYDALCIYQVIIELPVSASQDDIRYAFRRLSKIHHPDKNPNSRQRF